MPGLQRFWQAVALLAAALTGFGLILWLAANWDDFGRMGRFAVLQGALAIAVLAAAARPALRLPGALAALLATGALFAYFGQTYQTGADPWQLFALWAVLALPLALAARSDVLWLPWCLVAMAAVSLWAQAHAGHTWDVRPQDLPVHAGAAALAALVVALLAPWARRFTGAGPLAFRLATALFALLLTLTALGGLLRDDPAPQFTCGLLLVALAAVGFASRRGFDLFALSAATLALDTLLVAGAARWLLDGDIDAIGHLLLLGLAAAALLALSVRCVQWRAKACGAWAAGGAMPTPGDRPGPVVLLTALGAWLATLPLLGAVALVLGDWVHAGAGPYAVGALLLALAGMLLRRPHLSVFVEQLALPLLLAGLGTLGYGLARDLPLQLAAGLLVLLLLALAWLANTRQRWLQELLGAAAAGAAVLALHGENDWQDGSLLWLALHGVLLAGLAGLRRPSLAATATGWLVLVLVGLASASGMALLVGAMPGPTEAFAGSGGIVLPSSWTAAASVLLALAAGAAAARRWPALRRPGCAAVGLVAAVLCAFLPMLGAILLVAVLAAAGGRRPLALCGALAAAWAVGSFYYTLAWPLAHKAVLMVACGAALAALAWRAAGLASDAPTQAPAPRTAALLALSGLAALLVANGGIWRNERLIAQGQPVFVALAPVDPRSLMQGDYMRLRFQLPPDPDERLALPQSGARPQAVARVDARGVAELLRVAAPGQPLAAGEFAIALVPKDGDWTLVTDAWFFREGEAERFAQARYGEFRVAPDGSALLVGLANADLQALR
ncbi:GDYXXLXY domain-containing protein [Pseudorhodoferax soli]|uniref:Putative membrane-anchored protein n=1 Tax=Pseudorhodoferax soli TaxID=545864 RepID=A0A368Y9G5_9BURK|nr:GDYXXLXY domain-containing protein [Pseudorhodoferax soli]RCW76068.1 putative membrane-anchored protein [Pseudorhodoferax soli]